MKPPPRTRTKPDRNLKAVPARRSAGNSARKWQRPEQRKLLNALKVLRSSGRTQADIDYVYLKSCVPTRSLSEIRAVVEALKDKVILCAGITLRRNRLEERNVRKPIEEWTHVASAVAGTLEENISSAFSQMLMVSSTEPCRLRNFDPPQVYRPLSVRHTVPIILRPCSPVQGQHPEVNTAHSLLMLKSPAPAISPARRFPAPCQVVTAANSKICSLQQWSSPTRSPVTSCKVAASPQSASARVSPATGPSCRSAEAGSTDSIGSSVNHASIVTTSSPSTSVSPSLQMILLSSGTSRNNTKPLAVAQPCSAVFSCSSSPIATPFSTPTAAVPTRFMQTNKYTTKDSPTMTGDKYVVEFEKIYRFLSRIQNPSEDSHLPPMESAIVLDLLMSLPEELPLLDCNKLHKHLVQVYKCLSAPADSKMAKDMFAEQRAASTQRVQNVSGTNSHHNTTSDVTDSGGNKQSQTSGTQTSTSSQTGDAGLCPPLNPFMVPLKLLRRR
ncbi:snRNA-activating protein complex subunit 2 [Parambassis ranga]|uniref:snRNA-activating protein complex subunit 2 n=1 Tax=Parambassis ranga TaxID=210632 RepID=A0A6P7K6T0_9TELE|nr:snRNA-activating protein complex subunit 2 [Parambassis ranga]